MSLARHPASLLFDIEARQDAVLRQLEELELRIAQVLAEHGVNVAQPAPARPLLRLVEQDPQPDAAGSPEPAAGE